MINKILIANRGEIACRIIKTCRKMGIQSVAIYSDIDKDALFVSQADEAFALNGTDAQSSYLDIDKVIQICIKAKVDAVHPGYGFLSENALFAQKLQAQGIHFIGANITALEIMGSKSKAKQCMDKAGVPVIPGYHGHEQSERFLLKKAKTIGFPILIKAASGGGGKGMRKVIDEKDFEASLKACQREALKSFGDDTVLLEKYLENPRHIEVQIFADKLGNIVHLFERECSIQRRHQKIIEEAPASNLSSTIKKRLYQAAIDVAKACEYEGAGTVEFLVANNEVYFMEMNTRLQVEHPVTEMITGIDLVAWQILVANNAPLPLDQKQITCTGHAIEARIYAEDPYNNFLPQTGTLSHCIWPTASNQVRVDTGVKKDDDVSIYYDPMMAKIIAYDKSRRNCIYQLLAALSQVELAGIIHNRSFIMALLEQEAFQTGHIDIHYIEKNPVLTSPSTKKHIIAFIMSQVLGQKKDTLWFDTTAFRLNLPAKQTFCIDRKDKTLAHVYEDAKQYHISIDDKTYQVEGELENNKLSLFIDGNKYDCISIVSQEHITIIDNKQDCSFEMTQESFELSEQNDGNLTAPMPGNVIAILCKESDNVSKGQSLMIIEAMKMEHTITSPISGTIKKIFYHLGAKVAQGSQLISLSSAL